MITAKARALGISDRPVSEIVPILRATSGNDIPTSRIQSWLFEQNLLIYTGTEFVGPIEDVLKSLPHDNPLYLGLQRMKSAIFTSVAETIRCSSDARVAVETRTLVGSLAEQFANPDIIATFYAIDGGLPFASLTEAEYQAEVDAENAANAIAQKWARIQNEILGPCAIEQAALVAALTQALAEMEAP